MEKISEYIQDSIISLMLKDEFFLVTCKSSVPTDVFDGRIRQDLCQMIFNYFEEYKVSPKDDFRDYIKSSDERSKEAKLYRLYLKKIGKLEVNKKYIISKLIEWVQYQQITGAVLKSAELIKDGKLAEVKQTILDAFNTKLNVLDRGSDFWEWEKTGVDENEVVCRTGIDSMDSRLDGYHRSELFLWLGATTIGKSWALVDGTRSALLQGKNVVYYTLEMTAENTLRRLGMSISGMKRKDEDRDIIVTFNDGSTCNFKDKEVLSTDSEIYKSERDFYKRRKGKLLVKEGVAKKWTVENISAHLNQLEMSGFVPDIIFVDYADILRSDRKCGSDLEEAEEVCWNLRELGKQRNIAVVSATQGNRGSIDLKKVGLGDMAGSIGKARIADVIITLNQTQEELANHEMRFYAAKVREGVKGWTIRAKQAYEIGSFCLEDEEIFGDIDD